MRREGGCGLPEQSVAVASLHPRGDSHRGRGGTVPFEDLSPQAARWRDLSSHLPTCLLPPFVNWLASPFPLFHLHPLLSPSTYLPCLSLPGHGGPASPSQSLSTAPGHAGVSGRQEEDLAAGFSSPTSSGGPSGEAGSHLPANGAGNYPSPKAERGAPAPQPGSPARHTGPNLTLPRPGRGHGHNLSSFPKGRPSSPPRLFSSLIRFFSSLIRSVSLLPAQGGGAFGQGRP